MTPAREEWLRRKWLPHWLDRDGWRDVRAALVAGEPDALDRAWAQATARPWIETLPLPTAEAERLIQRTMPDLGGPAISALSVARYATRDLSLDEIEALAEACPRPPGRPPSRGPEMRTLSVYLPVDLIEQIEATAQALGVTAGETYRRAIVAGLPLVAPKDDGDHGCRVLTSVLR